MKLKDGWEIVEKGWYHNPALNVSVHKRGEHLWESVATDHDDKHGGRFSTTRTKAIKDAEKRAEK